MEINKLIEISTAYLKSTSYSTNRIYTYNWLWKYGILAYMQSLDESEYSIEIGNDFILTCNINGSIASKHRDMIKSVIVLNDVMTTGKIHGRRYMPINYPLGGEIGVHAQEFIGHLTNLRRNIKTVKDYKKRLSIFIDYLAEKGVHCPGQIDENNVLAFISTYTYGCSKNIASVKWFLRFMKEGHIIEKDFGYMLKNQSCKLRSERERIPSFYSEKEVKKIEQSVSKTDGVGKRDYAMVLLASRLGLRISDIAGLGFNNIDWDANQIKLIQYKTGNPITLPLLPIIGNAIIDYLRYGRKKSSSDKVFLSCRAPYTAITSGAVHSAIMSAFKTSGVEVDKRHHGGHALRFSLAQRLLELNTPMPIISEALGHRNRDVTREYVRIDLPLLQKCSLDVPAIDDNFYMQKGGCFYE
ncbi:MAG: site-specific integrase [Paludibacter sp.]|nr:site-specific integrase [Paludibacter sp.]